MAYHRVGKTDGKSPAEVPRDISINRENSSLKPIVVIYHFLCTLLFIGVFWYDNKIEKECPHPSRFFAGSDSFGGRMKYLTQINLVSLLMYYITASVNDLMPGTIRNRLTSITDWFFTTVVWSMSIAVFILFWGIYAIDRELVYPKFLDEYIPFHLNHMWHTAMLPVVIFEVVFVFHRHPSYRVVATTLIVFSVGYVTWTYIVYVINGKWPYPFQKHLGRIGFSIFAVVCSLFTGMIYYIGRLFSFRIWGQ